MLERIENEKKLIYLMRDIQNKLMEEGIFCQVYGRVKTRVSRTINDLRGIDSDDTIAFTIILENEEQCKEVWKILKGCEEYKTIKASNYMGENRKKNGYEALHFVGLYDEQDDYRFEVQIKTPQMLYTAERGVAKHGTYKNFLNSDEFKQIRDLFSNKRMKWRHIVKLLNELELKNAQDSLNEGLGKYAKAMGIDINKLLSDNPEDKNIFLNIVNEMNKKLEEFYKRTKNREILTYIQYNNKIVKGFSSGEKRDKYKAVIRFLRKQTYYFLVNEIISSPNDSIRKMQRKIKYLGRLGEQAFSELCVMLGFKTCNLRYGSMCEMKQQKIPHFYYFDENGKLSEPEEKNKVLDMIFDKGGIQYDPNAKRNKRHIAK